VASVSVPIQFWKSASQILTWPSREFLSLFMTYLNISGRNSVYNEVDFPGVLVGVKVAVGVDVLDAVLVGL
jgi:hypothetical protein